MSDLIDRQAAIMGLIFSDCTRDLTCGQMAKILYVIQALPSAQPETEKRVSETAQNVSDSDLIFRKAAIDALYHVDEYNGRSVEAIRNLPPAQSERTEKRTETHACDCISRVAAIEALYDVFFDDDLKAAYPDKADVVLDVIRKLPSAQADGDTISRQAAITTIQKAYADTEGGTDKCAVWKNVGLTNALHIMQDLPSAQPERKKGQWVPVTNGRGGFECDQCHNYAPSYQDGVEWLSGFCPNCGADMRGEQDG